MKMFGKDIAYDSFNGYDELLRRFLKVPNIFDSSSEAIDVAKSSIFLDGGIVLPTAAGLPLGLNVNGTYSLSFKSSVTMDIRDFFSTGSAKVKGEVYPTGTVEIVGMMSVNAFAGRTGLKSVSRLHSSTFVDGALTVEGNKLVSATLNMPRDKMELFEASVDFFTYENGAFVDLVSTNAAEEATACSPDVVSDFLAIRSCATLSYYTSRAADNDTVVMFAGPSKLSLTLAKTDDFDRHRFSYVYSLDETKSDRAVRNLHVSLDTQGRTRRSHRTSFDLTFDDAYEFASCEIQFPYRDVRATAKYDWGLDKKVLKAAVSSEGRNLGSAYAALVTQHQPGKYEVAAKLSRGDRHVLNWKGTLNVLDGKASLDGKMEGSFHQPIQVTGTLIELIILYV